MSSVFSLIHHRATAMLSTAEIYINEVAKREEIILQTSDGHEIAVSKRLLAAESCYFRALFYGSFCDSNSPFHKIPLTVKDISQLLEAIEQIHRHELPIWSLQHSVDLLLHTTFLQMDKLLPVIRKNILQKAEVPNLLTLYRLAYQRDIELAEDLWHVIINHFNKFAESEEYLNMTEEEFVKAMDDLKLNVESRQESYLLASYLAENPQCEKIEELSLQLKETGDGSEFYPVVMDRLPKEVLICAGGLSSGGATNLVEVYNPRNKKWRQVEWIRAEQRRAYHTFNIHQGRLYFCGGASGIEHLKSVECYDLNTKQWIAQPDMAEKRSYATSVTIRMSDGRESLLIIGGYNGQERLKSCELRNSPTTLSTIRQMSRQRSDCAAAILNAGIVVIGGSDGRMIHQDAEILDLARNQWRPLGRRLTYPRTGMAAVALNEHVFFIAGGYSGEMRLTGAEFFDIREGRWYQLPWMKTPRSNFDVELMDGSVIACGGFNGHTTTANVERFDLIAMRWQEISRLAEPRSALRLALLAEHDSIRDLIAFNEE